MDTLKMTHHCTEPTFSLLVSHGMRWITSPSPSVCTRCDRYRLSEDPIRHIGQNHNPSLLSIYLYRSVFWRATKSGEINLWCHSKWRDSNQLFNVQGAQYLINQQNNVQFVSHLRDVITKGFLKKNSCDLIGHAKFFS